MLQNYKILYVEDELNLREVISELLTAEGYECVSASDGFNACKILEQGSFDLLISDFRMPSMNGHELLNWCRKRKIHFPVIFLTADVELLPNEKLALEDCCSALLTKPVGIEIILKAIEEAKARNHDRQCRELTKRL